VLTGWCDSDQQLRALLDDLGLLGLELIELRQLPAVIQPRINP